jgi:hypothetical protein
MSRSGPAHGNTPQGQICSKRPLYATEYFKLTNVSSSAALAELTPLVTIQAGIRLSPSHDPANAAPQKRHVTAGQQPCQHYWQLGS